MNKFRFTEIVLVMFFSGFATAEQPSFSFSTRILNIPYLIVNNDLAYAVKMTLINDGGELGLIVNEATQLSSEEEDGLDEIYKAATADAAIAEEEEIVSDLVSINEDNDNLVWNEDKTKLLVVTWKAQGAYDSFIKPFTSSSENEAFVIWVTAAPQVKAFCNNFLTETAASKEDLDIRLKQYLGLNHTWEYDVFVELWVSPEDLFRPCVDPEVNDTACSLSFGEETPTVKNIEDYRNFYQNLYFKSFRSLAGVPWTGLGYTYDWGNQNSEIGASEFILAPSALYEIKEAIPTEDYCAQN